MKDGQALEPRHSVDMTQGNCMLSSLPTLKEVETFLVREALRRSDGNQSIAASLLGITRTALNKRLKRDSGLLP
jgi:DNA-binding protein Fis